MWQFIKRNGRILVVTILALAAGIMIGLCIGLSMAADNQSLLLQPTGNVGMASVLPETRIVRHVRFESCGHEVLSEPPQKAFIGYTQTELESFYAPCVIGRFDGEQIEINQSMENYCPKHYVLKQEGEDLCVYRTESEHLTWQLERVLDTELAAMLQDEMHEQLAKGIAFDSLSEIDAYLESIES